MCVNSFSFTWTVTNTCVTTIFGGEMNQCCSQTDQTGREFSGYYFLPTCGDKLSGYYVKVNLKCISVDYNIC